MLGELRTHLIFRIMLPLTVCAEGALPRTMPLETNPRAAFPPQVQLHTPASSADLQKALHKALAQPRHSCQAGHAHQPC